MSRSELHKKKRFKNYMVLAMLAAVFVFLFFLTIFRMS